MAPSCGDADSVTIDVRQAGLDDLKDLAPLFDGYRRFYGQPSDLARASQFLADRLAAGDSVIFLAKQDGEPIGFTQLYPTFSSVRTARTFILNDLFVAPDARGTGAGRKLLETARTYAREAGATRISLSTARDNLAAQQLYRDDGWHEESEFISFNRSLP